MGHDHSRACQWNICKVDRRGSYKSYMLWIVVEVDSSDVHVRY